MRKEELKATYTSLSDNKLAELYKTRKTLNPLAVPVLEEVLRERRLLETLAAEENDNEPAYTFEGDELKEFIKARLDDGESIESIRIDLEKNGIDIKRILKETMEFEQEVIDLVLNQAVEGKAKEEIDSEVKAKYNISESDIDRIRTSYKPTGTLYRVAGILMTVLGLLSLALFFYYASVNGSKPPVRYLLTAGTFGVLAYRSFKKYKILKG